MTLHFPWSYDAERKTVLDHRGTPVLYCATSMVSAAEFVNLFDKADAVGRLAAASGDLQAAARELLKALFEAFEEDGRSGETVWPQIDGLLAALAKAEAP